MALPLAAAPFASHIKKHRGWLLVGIGIAVMSMLITNLTGSPHTYLTREKPLEIKKVAAWLKSSEYREDPVLLTKMSWQSSYLPLYFPEIGSRDFFVSSDTEESSLRDFLQNEKPSILITSEEDKEYQLHIERFLGERIGRDDLVHTEGNIKVYDIRRLLRPENPNYSSLIFVMKAFFRS
jgi:hypothetical protein